MQFLLMDELLPNVLAKSTRDGLAIAGIKPVPVGVSKYLTTTREVSAIVGLVGHSSGAIMVNSSSGLACHLSTKMLGEECKELNAQVLDSMSEIANIIAGQTKALLSTTEWRAEKISCPSVVVGSSYFISHYKGMHTASVDFEVTDLPVLELNDRLFSVSISLMKV